MPYKLFHFLSPKSFITMAVAAFAMIPLTGCSYGLLDTTASVANIPAMQGVLMGGETPVAGATVILWETDPSNSGYGVTARQIQTAVDDGANFSFTPGYSCTNPNDFLYITATGGDVTDGSASPIYNPDLVMMAALGSCANMATADTQGAVHIIINELSTVAAAYALGNFITVNANGGNGQQLVYIGAPPANNATTGSCTGTGSAMTCTSAGLAHAFANALNLVNASNAGGAGGPSGAAYTTVPGNSSGSVPQALINTLGNIMQYCTNSGNATASSSTISSNCQTFFGYATPTNTSAPTDTLSALINIAHFPTNNVGTTSAGLFSLSSPYPAFSPSLSAHPADWSLAIAYNGISQGSFGIPQYVTLDADDTVYVLTADAHTPTKTGLAAMSSSGAGIWLNAMSTSYCSTGTLATDTNGHVFQGIRAATTATGCAYGIYGYSAANGAPSLSFGPGSGVVCNTASPSSANCPGFTAYDTVHPLESAPYGLAVDRLNNLWYNRFGTACYANCLQEFPYTPGSGYGAATNTQGNSSAGWDAGPQLLVDATGNVYTSGLTSMYPTIYVTPNQTPSSTPSYTSYLSLTVGGTSTGMSAVDSAGNVWTAYSLNIMEFTPTSTSGVITGYTPATISTPAGALQGGEFDGHDNLFAGNFNTSGHIYMVTSPSAPGYDSGNINSFSIGPCYAPSGAGACSSIVTTSDPNVIQIDSTGSLWVAGTGSSSSSTTPGFVVQIIGTAYPTWPQLSYGKFGAMPQ